MLVLVATMLAVLSPLLFGGHMSRLGHVKFRAWWLLLGALLAQIVIIEVVPEGNLALLQAVHLGTYVIAGVFVAVNWRIPGLLIIALGGACNGITIALNGGTLPASQAALKSAGIELSPDEFLNSGVLPNPTWAWLGDMFAWPEPMPLANVFSIGDVLIVVGALYAAHKISGSKLVKSEWVPRDTVVPWAPAPESDATETTEARAFPDAPAIHRGLTPLTGESSNAG
jgi:hypothetical protein